MTDHVDLAVLGAGSGGYAAALRAAELGLSVAMVERDKLGGTCLHRGCIPTKALLHAAEIADLAREGPDVFGIRSTFDGVDVAKVHAYKDGVVTKLHRGLTGLVSSRGIDLVQGEGRLASPTSLHVGDRIIDAENILLATGSVSKSLPGLPIDGNRIIDSEQALRLDRVPASVVVLGAGAIGCEFASVWRSFGADVTIVEALPHLVPAEEESSSKLLERAFRRRGIAFHLGAKLHAAVPRDAGVTVTLDTGVVLEAELLLVAVGRGPNSTGFGDVGVELDRGYVKVDSYCRTSVPTVFAVGDLRPGLQLAHVGFAEGIMVAEQIAGEPVTPIDYDGVPRVTYSSPEVASVGLTSGVARGRGYDIVTQTYDLAGNGKAQILQTTGAVTLVADADGPVLGVHLVGDRVGELVAEAQLIVNWEALPTDVAALIHPHPTLSEAMGEAHLALAGKALHSHG